MKFYRFLAIWIAIALLPLAGCQQGDSRSNLESVAPVVSSSLERYPFIRNGKHGYIDRSGKIVIPAQFDRVAPFSEDLAAVQIGSKFGYIDRAGKIVIPAQFDYGNLFSEGLAAVRIGDKSGYIDRTGKIVIPAKFPHAGSFSDGLAGISTGNTTGSPEHTIDRTGKIVAAGWPKPKPTDSDLGFDRVDRDNKYGYADRNGKVVIEPKFHFAADRFADGMAWIIDKDSRLGYIDRSGRVVIPPQYDYLGGEGAGNFERGLARVCLRGKCGYIDKTGKTVIPLKFDDAAAKFSDGLAWVKIGKQLGYIDRSGKVAIQPRFGYPGKAKAGREGEVTKCEGKYCFSAPTNFDRGLAAVILPGNCQLIGSDNCHRYGYIDTNGKLVFKF